MTPVSATDGIVGFGIADGVARLELRDAARRNALSTRLVDAAIARIEEAESAGCVAAVLAAEAPVFCAGADIRDPPPPGGTWPGSRLIAALKRSPIAWVAAVEGPAIGAGLSILTSCVHVVAHEEVWIRLPELSQGRFPTAMAADLARLAGPRRALEAVVSERRVAAAEAVGLGVVSEVVLASEVRGRADEVAALLASAPSVAEQTVSFWHRHATGERSPFEGE